MAELWLRLASRAGRSLLDVGCGTAIVAQRFQAEGYSVMGVDLAPAMLALARERLGPHAI
jgi:ubiquinone/menaquinone biosynthesis C-methylase UbiE